MKRRRTSSSNGGGSYTGGTGDIKPQILTITSGPAPAVAQYGVGSVALPVPRIGGSKGKATIFEFLWVDWYLNLADMADASAVAWGWLSTTSVRADGTSSTLATLNSDVLDPRTFALGVQNRTVSTSGMANETFPKTIDLTDRNGNGILVAVDKLIITTGSVGNTVAGEAIAKVGYRLVDVGIEEYVGIVQSQTGIS